MGKQSLGIDLGTTSVKISLIDGQERDRILIEKDRLHYAQRRCQQLANRDEQCPKQILRIVQELLSELNVQLSQMRGVGISGQMHGVMLWKGDSINSLEGCKCSRLITWQDGRCVDDFLGKMPKWIDNGKNEKRIASGYGWATLAWLKENGQLDTDWDRAGTIMDFLAAYLIQSKGQVRMSTQNAESWGYTDGDGSWTVQACPDLFPIHLVPRIVQPGTIIGHSSVPFGGIPLGIPVVVPLGDLQASLLPILHPGQAALHIGTSAQLAFINAEGIGQSLPPSIVQVPFFDGKTLLVAASLNGGNALESFIRQIAKWSGQLFGYPTAENDDSTGRHSVLFERLFQQQSNCPEGSSSSSSLSIRPTFLGERHNPRGGAEIKGWREETSLDEFICSIARGIVQNLAQMMPQSVLIANKISCLKLVGRAGQHIFQEEAKRQFPDMEMMSGRRELSAAYGAALHAREALMKGGNDDD